MGFTSFLSNKKEDKWNNLTTNEDLVKINNDSYNQPQIIFKHRKIVLHRPLYLKQVPVMAKKSAMISMARKSLERKENIVFYDHFFTSNLKL